MVLVHQASVHVRTNPPPPPPRTSSGLGMGSPFISSGTGALDSLGFMLTVLLHDTAAAAANDSARPAQSGASIPRLQWDALLVQGGGGGVGVAHVHLPGAPRPYHISLLDMMLNE